MSRKRQEEQKNDQHKCRNCETEFVGKYCSECGQTIKNFDKPFKFFFIDFVGNIFAFDTRLWRTLKAVLFKPGSMTTDFMKGKRIRYMPPFRFFIFVSFIFFLLLNIQTKKQLREEGLKVDLDTIQSDEINFETGEVTIPSDSLKTTLDNVFNKEVYKDSLLKNLIVNNSDSIEQDTTKYVKNIENLIQEKLSEDSTNHVLNLNSLGDEDLDVKHLLKYPEFYVERFLKFASWSFFLLMPVFALLLLLFFRKTFKYYVAHLIFALNQHSFLFVLLILMIVIKMIFPHKEISPENYLILISPIYLFFGAKILYKRGWVRTFFSLLLIIFIYFLILTPVVTVITMLVLNIV